MRIVGFVLKWTLLFGLVLAIAAALWPWKVVVEERLSAGPYTSYLERHVQRIDLEQTDPGFSFPDAFYDSQLYLVGEIHGAQAAQDFDLALMKHLHERVGVRWLMAELSYVQAERFNAYLETGDESHLAPVFQAWLDRAAQWGNQQHFDKIKDLHAYNVSLPEERRIRYFGVDRIHEDDLDDAMLWLGGMMADLPDEAPGSLISLRSTALSGDASAFSNVASEALSELQAARDPDDSVLGIDPVAASHLVRNILMTLDGAGRYDVIPGNIEAMVRDFGIGDDEPLYGFWGLFHVMKAVVNETGEPLALRLSNGDLPFADAITSIVMTYADSQQNFPSKALPGFLQSEGPFTEFTMSQNNPYLMYLDGIGDLRAVAGGSQTAIFELYTEGSPYVGDTRLRTQTGLLTKVFRFEITPPEQQPAEYIVLIDGSPALTAWEGTASP
ncbi:MAG: hypothetical protein AAFR65_04110 [Pseudomonadota bacterium]